MGVAMYLDDLNKVWDNVINSSSSSNKTNIVIFKLAKQYKSLCLKKFELFFEALTDHRRRSKRLMNGCHDIRKYSQQRSNKHSKTESSENSQHVSIKEHVQSDNSNNDENESYEQKEEEETEESDDDMFDDEEEDDIDGDIDDIDDDDDDDDDDDSNEDFMCPRCGTFEGKNSRSLKTHMRYCNKSDIMQYLSSRKQDENAMKCECGFSSHVAKGLQSHQLTCELIKRRLNKVTIAKMTQNA